MSDSVVAKRYAVALFQLGQEKSLLTKLEEEVQAIQQVFEENSVEAFFKHPKIDVQKKKQILSDAFKGYSKELLNTLYLMVDRHREEAILPMANVFIEMMNELNGVALAEVFSVRELTATEESEIQKVFAAKLGKKALRIKNTVDPTLLGGIKLKVGNRIYDGSVSGKLERIERRLVSVNY